MQANGSEYGLLVDTVRDTEEIVVKSLGLHLRDVGIFAGATIMGDGRVALILDAVAVAEHAHVFAEHHLGREQRAASVPEPSGQRQVLLLFRLGAQGYAGIPLADVQRLEEFDASRVERSLGQEVIQYRNEILPLVHLRSLLDMEASGSGEALQVIVHKSSMGSLGLVVEHVIDIVDDDIKSFQRQGVSPLISGSAVVQGRVTDLLDMAQIMRLSQARYFHAGGLPTEPGHG